MICCPLKKRRYIFFVRRGFYRIRLISQNCSNDLYNKSLKVFVEHSQKIVWKSPFYPWKRLFEKTDSLLLSRFCKVTLPVLTSPRSKMHVVDLKKLNRRHLEIRDIRKLFDKKLFLRKCHFTRQTLYACMLGFHLHSGDHHAHSTRSGKQREIVRY